MNAFLFAFVVALCTQSIICDDDQTNPALVFLKAVDEASNILAIVPNDVSKVTGSLKASSAIAAQSVSNYIKKTLDQLSPKAQEAVDANVAQLRSAQQSVAGKCTAFDYTHTIASYSRIYSNYIVECSVMRFKQWLVSSAERIRSFLSSSASTLTEDLSIAGSDELANDLIENAAQYFGKFIRDNYRLDWLNAAASFEICLHDSALEAKGALESLQNTIAGCEKPSDF